jgi:CoA:oxalate CoA-transferase
MMPLEGIKVLDFSHALAGPLCTYHLALLGADVVKIERPVVGDDLRHYTGHGGAQDFAAPFVAANAAKRSIALDLKSELGREAVRRLTSRSDIVVENFRPGVPKKLGIDYEALRDLKYGLIYCSITGFGANGELRDWPAYDHIVQAMSGIMYMNGEPDQGPLKVGIPFADTFSGYLAAFSIMTALFQRSRTGLGQFIDVGMLDATLVLLGQAIASFQLSGNMPVRTGNRGYRLTATADTYPTRDGHISIGANQSHQFEALCNVVGRADLLQDVRYRDTKSRDEHASELRAAMAEIFAGMTATEAEALLATANVPVSKVRTVPEILHHPHLSSRDLFVRGRVPGVSAPITLTGSGFRFSPDVPRREAAVPGIGEHTDEILREIGLL